MSGAAGLDLSLTGTGLAAWSPGAAWARHTIVTKGSNTDTHEQTARRLDRIVEETEAWLLPLSPDVVVVEVPSFVSNTGHAMDRAGLFHLTVRMLRSHWPQWAVAYCKANTRIRYGLGKGSGTKDAVLAAVIKRYMSADVRNNNEADAVLLAAMGSRWLADQPGFPSDLRTVDHPPAACLDALRAVQWPQALRA